MTHDFVTKVKNLRGELQSFLVSPDLWRTSRVRIPLSWNYLKFQAQNHVHVPKQPGVYAFIVRHVNNHFPGHGFIMYFGITGHDGSQGTLYSRYQQYLAEQKFNKRAKVHYMLVAFSEDLHFAFSPITDKRINLKALEEALNDAVMPWAVVNDFSAEIRPVAKALR
jgi:hypothetical protein